MIPQEFERLYSIYRLYSRNLFLMSFTATVTAVVAIAVLVPSSPKATIESVKAFSNDIVYQVNVTDQDGCDYKRNPQGCF